MYFMLFSVLLPGIFKLKNETKTYPSTFQIIIVVAY